ncbi:MAG: sigma-70 family RNA polymerase sigma factor [Candidatus Limiplasma sp.]|nr:sigma-70 family RNA polymerase sigma factor [Candidatus Limiplasma sp.]
MEQNEEQLRRLMEAYGDSILRMCALYLGDAALAQDLAQETFLRAYQHMESFRGDSSEKTWLTRIAINLCKDELKRPWRKHVSGRQPVEELLAARQQPAPQEDTVLREVMGLRPKEREVVLLRYYQQLKLEEIAQALAIPKGTVTSRLNRAKGRLRARLERWYFDE